MANREIKFRAWDRKDKKMYFPEELLPILNNSRYYFGFCSEGMAHRKNLQENCYILQDGNNVATSIILMQFTGLKDKNGKEIYEEDIIKTKSGEMHKVLFGTFCANDTYYGCGWAFVTNASDNNGLNKNMEVIGNIFESPELLK